MRGIDNTPGIDLPDLLHDQICHVLICAGQAATTPGTDGIRIVEWNRARAPAARDRRSSPVRDLRSMRAPFARRDPPPDARTVVLRDLGSRNGTFVNGGSRAAPLRDGAVLFSGRHVFVTGWCRGDLEAIRPSRAALRSPMSPAIARLCSGAAAGPLGRRISSGGGMGIGREFANAVHRERMQRRDGGDQPRRSRTR
jgi:hypothetical protein